MHKGRAGERPFRVDPDAFTTGLRNAGSLRPPVSGPNRKGSSEAARGRSPNRPVRTAICALLPFSRAERLISTTGEEPVDVVLDKIDGLMNQDPANENGVRALAVHRLSARGAGSATLTGHVSGKF